MARATRSQKASASSQSQLRQSQSKRTHRARNDDSQEEDDGDGDGGGQADQDDEMDDADDGDTDIKRKANELVRLALFTEHKRAPLRREDISKKVLGSNSRAYNRVFDCAQEILQKTFGMQLAELQTRAGLDADAAHADEELSQARNATGIKKKAAAVGSKTYILRSVLHPTIIEHAALTDEQILEEEVADAPSDDDDDDDEAYMPRFYGSIISWTSSDQLGATGILYTLLALILVSGRVMSDMELLANLKRLGLPPSGHVTFTSHSTHKTQSVDTYLATLIRQGYLDRVQVGDSKKSGKGAKRGRMTQADEENGATYEWRWGSRAHSEVGEQAVAKFVAEFMVGDAGDDDEDEGGRGRREGAAAKLERMTKGIERAAGGQLTDIK
ncbi:putative MAGE-domain-containing protein [Lyophyllum shimeji]|uniref:MAGE-domain-containing protein n=1 Tax=Lyophyllum shimeji TaxID=47721 RepID=A0A9P3PVN4_LYOSH|nr:putative MAGE-domain-containing protein [Lyophyllum shimeji]